MLLAELRLRLEVVVLFDVRVLVDVAEISEVIDVLVTVWLAVVDETSVGVAVTVLDTVAPEDVELPLLPDSTASQKEFTAGRTCPAATSAPQAWRIQPVAAAVNTSLLEPTYNYRLVLVHGIV